MSGRRRGGCGCSASPPIGRPSLEMDDSRARPCDPCVPAMPVCRRSDPCHGRTLRRKPHHLVDAGAQAGSPQVAVSDVAR